MCVILKSLVVHNVQADLEKLKSDASLTLNEAFFGQLADAAEGGEGRAVAFLQVEFRTCPVSQPLTSCFAEYSPTHTALGCSAYTVKRIFFQA